MAQISESLCLEIIRQINAGKRPAITKWELYQLAVIFLTTKLAYMPFEIPPFTGDKP